ncbi:MAG TPA: BREX-1 system adenine-specific DNA-methyltransferase PglX, partial [Anaerolineales bacterium]|nr:BREX-1 system adenine-specific DNA-methyltransferase PglX [Anaerolineales bacterium]
MDTTTLKKFAQGARRQLLEQVSARMEQVLRTDSVEIREKAKVVEQLKAEIEAHGKIAVIDRVAYTWFNRFCALRFMDVNHYTRIGAVSPVEGGTQPEVLLEAKQGHVDEELARFVNPQVIFSLLNGQRPASDPQGEAYRLLLVGVCNSYSEVMPFLFEKIEDYTELLMPLDLLSENSVLHDLREALSPEACEDVEVIGWLYQYYISERKDKVFEALKQNQKIEAGDIPAATQLFTPHWIVRYLVENSLGRLWMLNHPNSGLREKMEYYIEGKDEGGMMKDEEGKFIIQPSSFILLNSPEEIKLLDPACGSGHILTYAFDLLAAIYEEEGYASSDVAKLILEKNIFGVEIDPRAGALAAFALVMKARAKDRRFFTRTVNPNICVLENVTFNDAELKQYMNAVGRDLFTEPLMETLRQFEQADNFGSLIRPMLTDASYVRGLLEGKNLGGDLFLFGVHERVLKVLKQAEFLAPRYHVVVANPPYMGGAGMNDELKEFAKDYYPDSKSDTYSMFVERNLSMLLPNGFVGMITIPSWMFLSSFQAFREKLLRDAAIVSFIHNGRGVWGSDFGSCSFVLLNSVRNNFVGSFKRLFDEQGKIATNEVLIKRFHDNKSFPFYFVPSSKFNVIP